MRASRQRFLRTGRFGNLSRANPTEREGILKKIGCGDWAHGRVLGKFGNE